MGNKNKIIRLQLIQIYGEICMLGEPLSIENYITLHHLIKKEHKGATSIKNGALLSKIMHEYLHYIECWYIGHYHYINDYLRYYKETEDPSEKDKMNCYIKKLIKINRKV